VFASTRDAKSAFNLYWQRVNGTSDAQRLTESKNSQYPASWHPSGQSLVFVEANPQTRSDVMVLRMEGSEVSGWRPGKPTPLVSTHAAETYPMLSPDGRWLAYASDESGQNEVWVRPFPGPGAKWQISRGGAGIGTVWSQTRNELFYTTPDQQIMVVSYAVDHEMFLADQPRSWSDTRFMRRPRQVSIDLHPDGDRFAVAAAARTQAAANQGKLVFVFNFFDELRQIAPVQKN
jgi:serine/threonine-protein kinase